MNFTCTKENFSQALNLVSPVASRQNNLPILANVLIQTTDTGVALTATNLELGVKAVLRAKVEQKGAFTIPAKTLTDYVNLLPEGQLTVRHEEQELVVESGSSKTRIKGAPADEFPVLPEIEVGHTYMVEANLLREGLSRTVIAAAKNDIRPELSGVYMGFFTDRYGGLILAATDSYRLSETRVPVAQGEGEVKLIVPARTVYEMIRLVSLAKGEEGETAVRLFVSENQIGVRYNQFELTARLVEGTYPDYAQIIPSKFKTTVAVPVEVLTNKIRAAGLFTTTGVNAVSFDLNAAEHSLGVSSVSTQTGEHHSAIDAEVVGEENSILLNHRYVLDGLQSIDGETEFKVNGPDAPCMFAPKGKEDYLYLVMPIRQ